MSPNSRDGRLDAAPSGYSYDAVVEQRQESYTITNVAFLSYTILVWDHVLTFGDEVELIWKSRKTLTSYLFLLNRYMTPLGFAVCFYPWLHPNLTDLECKAFMRYEGCMIMFGLVVTNLMMLQRIVALYEGNHVVALIGGSMLVTFFGLSLVVISLAYVAPHLPPVYSCSQIARPDIITAGIWLLVVYETFVIGCILARTLPFKPHRNMHTITRALTIDGLLYYIVVLTVNIAQCIMFIRAPNGIKSVLGQLKVLLTVTMMSRIALSLPKEHRRLTLQSSSQPWEDMPSMFSTIQFSTQLNWAPGQGCDPVPAIELQTMRSSRRSQSSVEGDGSSTSVLPAA